MENFGQRLKKLRKSRHLTQAELAAMVGLSPSAISMYEKGKREPNNARLKKISGYFGVGVNYLINGKADGPKNITELLAEIKRSIYEAEGLTVNGKTITEADKEELYRAMLVAANVMFPGSVQGGTVPLPLQKNSAT